MSHFDLNLVRVFIAIWDHRSVTLAAENLKLTQPAVSQSLRRLRDLYSDPLFLRAANMMEPTQKAKDLYRPLRQALETIAATVHSDQAFDPKTSNRRFSLTMSDIAETNLLPKLAAELQDSAPSIQIAINPLDSTSVIGQLRSGQTDLALGHIPDAAADGIKSTSLWQDSFVCLMSKDHPKAGRPLTLEEMARLRFVDIQDDAPGFAVAKRTLEEFHVKRKVVMTTAHYASIPKIVRETDLVALFPYSPALHANAQGGFYFSALPFSVPQTNVAVHYHVQFQSDPGIQWLHGIIVSLLTSMVPPDYNPKASPAWT
ncbi:LysR family transcriptional regulator [Celeribacter sp. ULVN23_4]